MAWRCAAAHVTRTKVEGMCPPENCLCCHLYQGVKICTMVYSFLCIWNMVSLFGLKSRTKLLCGDVGWDPETAECPVPNDSRCGADCCAPWKPMSTQDLIHRSATCGENFGPKRLGTYCGDSRSGSWGGVEERFTCCDGWANTEDPQQLLWCTDGSRDASDQASTLRVAVQFWGWAVLLYCYYYGVGQFDSVRIDRLWKLFAAVCICDHVLSLSYMFRASDFSTHPHMNTFGIVFSAIFQIWFIIAVRSLAEQVKSGAISEHNVHGVAVHQGVQMMGPNGQVMMQPHRFVGDYPQHQGQMMYPAQQQPLVHVQGQLVGQVGQQNPVMPMAVATVQQGQPLAQGQPHVVQGQVIRGA